MYAPNLALDSRLKPNFPNPPPSKLTLQILPQSLRTTLKVTLYPSIVGRDPYLGGENG